jgi:phenylacetate-coenzyme A ligase PaaK-like adenylate-forming protein
VIATTTTPSSPAAEIERLRALAAQLRARDAWSREQLLVHQAERLRALLRHAVAHSPFYQESLGPDAPERPLAELPTLPKATLMEHFDQVAPTRGCVATSWRRTCRDPIPASRSSASTRCSPPRAPPGCGA